MRPAPLQGSSSNLSAGNGSFGSRRVLHGDDISLEGVSVVAPTGATLARALTVQVREGESLLVTGPNGAGKTGIVRVLAGLWPLISGRMSVPEVRQLWRHDSASQERQCCAVGRSSGAGDNVARGLSTLSAGSTCRAREDSPEDAYGKAMIDRSQ